MDVNFQKQPLVASLIDQMVTKTTEHVRRSGIVRVDPDELKALREGAKVRVYTMATLPFSEAIASDRELSESIKTAKGNSDSLAGKCAVLETRLTNAREQTARVPAPRQSLAGIAMRSEERRVGKECA